MAVVFKNTPLNEVIFGIQFKEPILSVNNIYELISLLKDEYTQISEHSPLPSIIESPNKAKTQMFLKDFVSRKHIVHKEKHKLIQIQPDRLLFNWRKESEKAVYPKYDKMYREFKHVLNIISGKIREDVTSHVNQYEFTYIDHVYLESFGIDEYEIDRILNIFSCGKTVKDLNIEYSLPKEELGGVLNVLVRTAKNKKDNRKLFVIENTCRGFSGHGSMDNWFDSAHEALLDNFLEMTSDQAKKVWAYQED